jgi:plasmid stability protein
MKTTFDLPDDLIREVKLRAVVQRRTVKDLVTELLRRGLGMTPPGRIEAASASPRVTLDKSGLPIIRCVATAPASQMSVEELLKLDEETLSQEDVARARIAL